jgi:hypothetical protein
MAVEDDVDALYAADPDEFVAGRQALARRLRSEGDKERAAEVTKLRRPTAAAWAVNQLARRHGDEVAALVALGDDLRRTHERLLEGGRDDDTVALGRRRRGAIADLVDRAAAILTDSGRAAGAHRDAISATLDAASLDPDVAADVTAGRLAKELDPPSGFGEFDWSVPAATAPARPAPAKAPARAKGKGPPAADNAADPEAERAAERQARRREEARQRAASARTAATRARDLADQARDAAERADAERDRLEEEVVRARKTAVDSRRTARELRDAAHEAERQATALEAASP